MRSVLPADSKLVERKPYRRTLKKKAPPVTLPGLPQRIAIDPPVGARVVIGSILDPYGIVEEPVRSAKVDSDGVISPGEMEWVSQGQPRIVVLRSIRHDPLGWSHSHDHIAEPEYLAGRHWQSLYERAEIGSIQAVDTSKEPVDGGKVPELLTDGQRNAMLSLRSAAARLEKSVPEDRPRGVARVRLVQEVLAEGKFMRQIAAERGNSSRGAVGALSREFRRSLTILGEEFGFIGDSRNKAKITGWRQSDNDDGKEEASKEAA